MPQTSPQNSFLGNNQHSGKSVLDRFEEKYIPEPNSGCWLWLGAMSNTGRSCFTADKRTITGHRFAYLQFRGEIPLGMELDHLCNQPSCVNPYHLEPVVHGENVRRGWKFRGNGDLRRGQVLCVHGHDLSGNNVYNWRSLKTGHSSRKCKTCDRVRASEYSWGKRHGYKRDTNPI